MNQRNNTTKEAVIKLLTDKPKTRDNDSLLIAYVWHSEYMGDNDVATFLNQLSSGKLTSPETIRRIRQKVQEVNPHLRGSKYNHRHEVLEPKFIDEVVHSNPIAPTPGQLSLLNPEK